MVADYCFEFGVSHIVFRTGDYGKSHHYCQHATEKRKKEKKLRERERKVD